MLKLRLGLTVGCYFAGETFQNQLKRIVENQNKTKFNLNFYNYENKHEQSRINRIRRYGS